MKTFSINAIAELLEKDRQTIVRALRSTPADATERGQPRWKMATAVAALELHNRANEGSNSGGADPELTAIFAKFDVAYEAMTAAPTLAKRRAMALKIRPLIASTDIMLRAVGKANGQDEELVQLRADQLYRLALRGFEAPCAWTHDQTHELLGC